jgi:hypothetical protein
MPLTRVLAVGNGESRRSIHLPSVKSYSSTVGCNALHRDFFPDHLVCCDRRMVEEAVKSVDQTTLIYTRDRWYSEFKKIKKHKNVKKLPDLFYQGQYKQDHPDHWGSGSYALLLSALQSPDEITMIGFDLYSNQGLVNNLYKGSKNYAASTSNAVDPRYWIYQTKKIFEHFENIQFQIVNDIDWELPKQWIFPNVRFENKKKFVY